MHDAFSQAQTNRTIEVHLVLALSTTSVHLLESNLWVVIESKNLEVANIFRVDGK